MEKRIFHELVGLTEIRAEGAADVKIDQLEGYAAIFNVETSIAGMFKEKISENAFDRALRESHDVRALVDHDSSRILGRTKAGTLKLSTDNRGLRCVIALPDTTAGRDIRESIRRGDVSQMSFAFEVLGETWDWNTTDKIPVRTISDVKLYDVSAVTFPAYEQTEIATRGKESMEAALQVVRAAEEKAKTDIEKKAQTDFGNDWLETYKRKQRLIELP